MRRSTLPRSRSSAASPETWVEEFKEIEEIMRIYWEQFEAGQDTARRVQRNISVSRRKLSAARNIIASHFFTFLGNKQTKKR